MTKKELAAYYHPHGYNCAQAVLCSFSDELDIPVDLLFRMSEAFGGGMGGTGETCGAVTAMYLLSGLRNSMGPKERTKAKTYKEVRELGSFFRDKNGSLICRELKGENPTGKPLRSCAGCIEDAVEIAENLFR